MNEAKKQLPQVYRVDIFETRGCGASTFEGSKGPILPI
jgi:hypothetical protein